MMLVAKTGEDVFLLADSMDFEDPKNLAYICDTEEGVRYPAEFFGSVMKFMPGQWDPVEHDDELVGELLKLPWHGDHTDDKDTTNRKMLLQRAEEYLRGMGGV